ncbi:response regulator receiver protein [Desulfofundulus kuznetsovii DSM 6115]|uniref:Stage 0 sporulation protein A homolog n=1 Tax=Desulfofundulus kuznetsovii (strain DSM 6115 / VKM B-1805 / 17) TaxID=760568 RepID=A0AAU8P7U0_DESK7|nr:response regulator receiver protein [Desulfofundulus kuznetsovii DSM 6115]
MRKETLDVLIVDDQPGVRYLLDILIREFGHRVHTAENGLVAIEKVRQIHPDVIFMDVRMPLMDGLEALRRIRRIAPDTIVIIMTAYISEQTKEQALKNGALCCMSKPFDIEKVKALIQDLTWNQKQNYFWGESYVI